MLIATDLPEPVVPATSRCGMRARSAITASPPIVLPRQRGSLCFETSKSSEPRSSRRYTVSRVSFGSSMPIALRPGITATRAETALIERAMSSDNAITRDDLMPGAGSNSYRVTTGPGWTWITSPFTPKSRITFSSRPAVSSRMSSVSSGPSRSGGSARNPISGFWYDQFSAAAGRAIGCPHVDGATLGRSTIGPAS